MKIVFIGAGNLATCLSLAMKDRGMDVAQVFSRTMDSALALAGQIGCIATDSYDEIVRDADLYIISVSDKAIGSVLDNISKWGSDTMFCHTAGSVSMDIFKDYGIVNYGVLYPMQTFSKQKKVDFSKIPFFIEASDEEHVGMLKSVAETLSPKVFVADSAARKALHISAVFACNFANHMFDISSHLLAKHNIPFDVMLPLIDETAEKVHTIAPHKAQTGPAVRNDTNVMNNHIAMLEDEPELKEIYEKLSMNIRKWAQ